MTIPQKVIYTSAVDGRTDWYLRTDAGNGKNCVVFLHGHGSDGNQLFSRPDMKPHLEFLNRIGASIISPNLRENAWMNPAAVADLAMILQQEKAQMQFQRCIFASASMGGTGALIFACRHPELVDALVVLGGATSLRRYREWCAQGDLPIHKDIRDAIDATYSEDDLELHDVCAHASTLSMPLRFYHSVADRVIPVCEMKELQRRMAGMTNARFTEVPPLAEAPNWWSNHDAPLAYFETALLDLL